MLLAPALFMTLAARCAPQVAPETLAAIAKTESDFNTLAIHDNTTHAVLHPRDMPQAITLARQKIAVGHSVDLGLMQINSRNLAALHLSIAHAFEACPSLHAGATLLAADYGGGKTSIERQAALLIALSRYNTGTAWLGFQNGYVAHVLDAARYVVPKIAPSDKAVRADKAALPKPAPRPPAPSRNVFADSSAGNAHSSGTPSWDVFPNSIGPAGFAEEHAVTLSAQRLPSQAAGSGIGNAQ